MKHSEVIKYARQWLSKSVQNCERYGHYACPIIISELVAYTPSNEIPDVLGWSGPTSILIECKTSLSDFKADLKKSFRRDYYDDVVGYAIGNQRWYMAEKGIIPVELVPEKWGLLEIYNRKIYITKPSQDFNSHKPSEVMILISLLRRLDIKSENVSIKTYYKDTKNNATVIIDKNIEPILNQGFAN